METKHADALRVITDDLLMAGEVQVEHLQHFGSAYIVCYTVLDTGQQRIAIYDSDLESIADLVADE